MIRRIMLLTGPSPVAELQGNRDQAHAGVGRLPGAELRRQRSHVRIVSGAPVCLQRDMRVLTRALALSHFSE